MLSLFISKLSSELSHLTMCIFLEDLKKEEISSFCGAYFMISTKSKRYLDDKNVFS